MTVGRLTGWLRRDEVASDGDDGPSSNGPAPSDPEDDQLRPPDEQTAGPPADPPDTSSESGDRAVPPSARPDGGPATLPHPTRRRSAARALIGAALVLIGIGAVVVAGTLTAAPDAELVGGNFPVNEGAGDPMDISAHNSPMLARNPTNGANVVVANRIDLPRFSCALHVSADGGASFRQTPVPIPAGEEPKCYAPDVAFDADGTMFLLYVTLAGEGNRPNAAWLSTSQDGGRSLSRPRRVLGELSFQVRLAVHPTEPGRLYVAWLEADSTATLGFAETGHPIRFTTSSDGGSSWSDPVRVSPETRERVVAPSIAVADDGTVHLAYLDLRDDRLDYHGGHQGQGGPAYPGTWHLIAATSTDGGGAWSEAVVDELSPIGRFIVFLPDLPQLAVDRDTGTVYAAYHDARLGDADVWVWRSDDRGASWSRPVRVNDTAEGDGTAQYLPQIAVAPTGRLDVVYYDRRDDPDDVMNDVSLQTSADGARRFSPALTLTDQPFDSRIGFNSFRDMADLGARLALLSTDDKAFAVWSDTRAGTEDSGKQDLVRALVELSAPPSLPWVTSQQLRYGGLAATLLGALLVASGLVGRRIHQDEADEQGSTAAAAG